MENLEKNIQNNKISSNIYMNKKYIKKIEALSESLFLKNKELSGYQKFQKNLITEFIKKDATEEQYQYKIESLKNDLKREMEIRQ